MSALLISTLALTPLAIATRTASAAQPGATGAVEIEVLSLSSNDAVEEAGALSDAFKHALIEAQGVSEHAPTGGKGHALEAIALTVGCDDAMAPACAPKIAQSIGWKKFIYGTLKKSPPNKLTATLHFYNDGDIKTVVKTFEASPMVKDGTAPELVKIALEALYDLVGGPPKGKVDVTVVGPAASESGDLFENGEKIGHLEAGKAVVELSSGAHTLELRVPGYASTTGQVDVNPGGVTLQLSPVRLAPSKPLDWQLYGGIGAIAVGAVFVGVGVATSLSIKDANDDPTFTEYRKRFPGSVTDTCAEAKAGHEGRITAGSPNLAPQVVDLCDSVSRKQKMQFVWYGLGAAFIGGGTILILTDKHGSDEGGAPSDSKTASSPLLTVKLQPMITPHSTSFSLTGAF